MGKTPKSRPLSTRFSKPSGSACDTCVLQTIGHGFVPASGPETAPILMLGEGPGYDETALGEPFVGASGAMLTRLLRLIGKQKENYRFDNSVRCVPPGYEIRKFPAAIPHCSYKLATLQERPRVVVTLGQTATRYMLDLLPSKEATLENFHGTVSWSDQHQCWVVPTFHPSHLLQGATNLIGVVLFDLQRAHEVSEKGWEADPASIVIDPPREWFRQWADTYIALVKRDGPYAYPLGTDIETPEKGADEATLIGTVEDATYKITRVNLSYHPDEGVTVPFEPGYIEILNDIFAAGGVQYYWYKGYDYPRLKAAGMPLQPHLAWDCMWMWKALQSDLPAGLGFAAPFYSKWGAWKHLSKVEPGKYAGIDGFQTRRVGDGCVSDLIATGRWPVFDRHMHEFHRIVLQPATDVGLPVDRERLITFKGQLDTHAVRLLGEIQGHVPQDLLPLTPKLGLTRPPAEGVLHTKARTTKKDGTEKKDKPDPLKVDLYLKARVVEKLVLREVLVCKTCGKQEIAKTHNCQPKLKGVAGMIGERPKVELKKDVVTVRRWFWQEPFNPDSPQQIMAYVLAKHHTPGTSKATGNDSVDRETLSRLIRETGDPLYEGLVDYRAVQKIRGTYVIGTEKRLDGEDRVHGVFGFKPSTMRLNGTNPNLQNVVADKGGESVAGKESLAAGFRKCIVARGRMVEEGSGWEDVSA